MKSTLFYGLVALLMMCTAACSDDNGNGDTDMNDVLGDSSDQQLDSDASEMCSDSMPCTTAGTVCDTTLMVCVENCATAGCDTGNVCDQLSGLCVAGDACSANADCTTEGDTCNVCRGVCEPDGGKDLCETDSNCFTDEYCDRCTGTCESKIEICGECTFNYQCGDTDDRCVDIPAAGGRFCAQSCETLIDCPDGYECAENADGKQCIPSSGSCETPGQCMDDNDCPGLNEICRMNRCVPGCTMGGCPSALVCERGNCVETCDIRPGGCTSPSMCNPMTGLCEIEGACLASRDCPDAETYCDTTTNMCVPGCEVDNDCRDATRECVGGACVPRGCKGAWSCGFGQVCDLTGGQCMDAMGPYCDMCDPDAMGSCGPEANKCLSLQDDMGNDVGSFCFVACSTDPDNECPQGYSCTELQDQDGNPAGEVCFRDCTFDPFE